MNKKIIALILVLVLMFTGCNNDDKNNGEDNPMEFGYDMLDLSMLADEVYSKVEISDLTRSSIEKVTDETVLTEQYYLNLDNVIAMEIRSAEGKFGVCDLAIVHVEEGKAEEVIESLERRKDDRINEFSNFDVYDSYETALNAEIYEAGELVIMLMMNEDDVPTVKELIENYLP